MNKETLLQRKIMIDLSSKNCMMMRMQSGIFYTRNGDRVRIGFPGLSDLLAIDVNGTAAFIEVKTDDGRASPQQIKFIKQMQARGYRAGIARSCEDAEEIAFGILGDKHDA